METPALVLGVGVVEVVGAHHMRVLGLGLVGLEVGRRVYVVYVVAWAFLGFEAFATFFLGFLELEVQTIVHRYFDSVVAEGVLGVPHRMGLGPELEDYKQGVLEVGTEVHHIAADFVVDFVVDFAVDFVVDFVVKIYYLTVEHH